MDVKIRLEPSLLKKDLEFVYDDKNEKILGWYWKTDWIEYDKDIRKFL